MRGFDRTALTAIAVGALVGLGSTSAQAGGYFIIDDFNTGNLYDIVSPEDDPATELPTPIDAGNIVWGVAGGGTATRFVSLTRVDGPDRLSTEICASCQAGHGTSSPGTTGNFDFRYEGPSVAVKALSLHFKWSADQPGATGLATFDRDGFADYVVEIPTDLLPDTGTGGVGAELVDVWVPLDPNNPVFDDLESFRLDIFGVAALDFSIDDIHIAAPAPASLALFGVGLAGLGLARRRKA